MPKIKLLIFFVCVYGIASAQRGEVGISFVNMNVQRENSKGGDTLTFVHSKIISSLQPVLTYNQINFNDIDKYIQVGFFYEPSSQKTKSGDNTGVMKAFIYGNSESLRKSFYIKIGIDKRYYFERLVLSIGVNIPFQSQFYMKGVGQYYYYDNNRTYYEYDRITDTKAPVYTTGINLHQSLFYALSKKLYLGLDLNMGVISNITNGKRTYIAEVTDVKNNNTNRSEQVFTYKFTVTTALSFQPILSLRYCVTNKKPKLKT